MDVISFECLTTEGDHMFRIVKLQNNSQVLAL